MSVSHQNNYDKSKATLYNAWVTFHHVLVMSCDMPLFITSLFTEPVNVEFSMARPLFRREYSHLSLEINVPYRDMMCGNKVLLVRLFKHKFISQFTLHDALTLLELRVQEILLHPQ